MSARIVCRDVTELATDYLEGSLPESLMFAIERHLAGCPYCEEYLARMRLTIAAAGRASRAPVPTNVLDVLQRAFDEYAAAAPPPGRGGSDRAESGRERD